MNNDNHKKYALINVIVTIIFVILFDQVTKLIVIRNLGLGESKPIIKDVFEFHHIHNTGSAWGLFSGKTWALAVVSVILSAALCYVIVNLLHSPYYRFLRFLFACILGGAIGNMIDRFRLGYVTDFLYFKLINFPVFNVADIFVTVPIILLVILFIFKYRGNDFDVLLGEKLRMPDGTYVEKKELKKKLRQGGKNDEEDKEPVSPGPEPEKRKSDNTDDITGNSTDHADK